MKTRSAVFIALIAAITAVLVENTLLVRTAAQNLHAWGYGSAMPSACTAGDVYFLTSSNTVDIRLCDNTNSWTSSGSAIVVPAASGSVPSGAIVWLASGSCPTGYTEQSALDGKMVRGTLTANGDVGGTGGSDTYTPAGTNSAPTFTGNSVTSSAVSAGTPAGTNSTGTVTATGTIAWPAGVPTFTGSALGTHAHELPWQIPSTTTIRQIAVGTFGTGTSRAATAVSAAGTSNTTSAAVALSQAVSAGTPAGTVAWPAGVPTFTGSSATTSAETFTGSALGTHTHTTTATGSVSAPTFTGTQASVIPAYVKLIACAKN